MIDYRLPLDPDGKARPVYVAFDGRAPLPGSPAQIWPVIVDYTSWQTYSYKEQISGTAGAVGEVVLLGNAEPGFEGIPPYYARTIKLVQHQQIIWKTFPKRDTPLDPVFFGIVDFYLHANGPNTELHYHVYYEILTGYENDQLASEYGKEISSTSEQMFRKILVNLAAKLRNDAA